MKTASLVLFIGLGGFLVGVGGCDFDSDELSSDTIIAESFCRDGMLNNSETDIDCGGGCEGCADSKSCNSSDDCLSRVCEKNVCQPPSCNDAIWNGTETDLDCGGSCKPCSEQAHCIKGSDCVSGVCTQAACAGVSKKKP